jgi:hypothetical protein
MYKRFIFFPFVMCLLALACSSKSEKINESSLEILIEPMQDNPETLDTKSPAFNEFAEKMAQSIERKLGSRSLQHYDLAIVTIFQNEAPYLKEWIEFHKLVGVQHFYLFNNLSSDSYLEVLKPYILNGEVDLIEWPYRTNEEGKNWSTIQRASYLTTVKLVSGKVKWLALIDSDEFIIPLQSDRLLDSLEEYENYGGVGINWQMYGTSGVATIPLHKLLTETLLMKAPKDFAENRHIKTIVRPERVVMCHVHHCLYQPGYFAVDTNKEMVEGPRSCKVLTDKIRINHYWSKDEEFFYSTKIARRKKWQESQEAMLQRVNNANQEEDKMMLRFVPALRKKMGF